MKHKRQKGKGVLDDVNKFLKGSKIISSLGNVLLPLAGGALGTLAIPGVGSVSGAAAGSALNEGLKALGYGKRRARKQKGRGAVILPNAFNSVNNTGVSCSF